MQLVIHVGRSIERKRCEERITVGDARGGAGAGGAEQKKITLSDGDTTTTATTAIIRVCVVACCCCVAAVFESQQRTTRGVGGVCVVGPEFGPQYPSQFSAPGIKYSAIDAPLKGESNAQSFVEFGCYLSNLADFVTKPDFSASPTPGRTRRGFGRTGLPNQLSHG